MTAVAPTSSPISRPRPTTPESTTQPPVVTRRPNRAGTTDPLSDRATSALIRRTLCSQQLGDKGRDAQVPIEELLPPLTSRNDVDLQLYAFLSIILREFVQTWYNKITPDEDFVAEIIQIIAHCTRSLEQRFRKVDLESLIFDEIPDLLDKHITSYRIANQVTTKPPVHADPRQVYHALNPIPHLSPAPRPDDPLTVSDQRENETLYRQLLVQGVLAILLPTEDLENPCLTALVGQIFSELIIGNVIANKASQPWLLYEAICISARVIQEKKTKGDTTIDPTANSLDVDIPVKGRRGWSAQAIFLYIIQFGIMLAGTIRFIALTLAMTSSLPPRTLTDDKGVVTDHGKVESPTSASQVIPFTKAPIMAFRIWGCLGNLIGVKSRMPWLDGFLSLLQLGAIRGPGRIAGLDGPIDSPQLLDDGPLSRAFSFAPQPSESHCP